MKKLLLLPVATAIFLAWWYYHQWQHWLAYATGSYNVQGVAHNYNAFSGSLSDVGQITLFFSVVTAVTLVWRSHTCHRYWWCWRHPHHRLDGTPYLMCAKHHPDDVQDLSGALAAHEEANDGN